jgi:hypothetical protein
VELLGDVDGGDVAADGCLDLGVLERDGDEVLDLRVRQALRHEGAAAGFFVLTGVGLAGRLARVGPLDDP